MRCHTLRDVDAAAIGQVISNSCRQKVWQPIAVSMPASA
jgi:hypothetical protein